MGLQVKYKSSSDSEKAATLYVNGEEYTELKEEPTTQSKEEKAESKKEKIEPESGTPLENHGKLSIDGTDVVDKNGKKYQLKGVSTHGLAWFPEYVNKDAFQTLRDDWGANLIRLAMYTGESGGYCQDGDKSKLKSLVDDGVEYATELGMYVIIDWHILSDNNPSINQDEAIAFFDEMSAKYVDYDNVLYEICNEPNGSTSWSDIKEYAEAVIPVIRANDKDAIIIVGTPTWSQDVEIAADDPITGQENIAYTTHFYAA
ncbi:MAG: glycoside hydrolase family 5 protein, partial [Eubacterium sp.]|nr:glycoside hydrolase family 5 protein [Eubacterium sp.]